MPPQWNPYEIPDAPGLPPLVADKSPLDDILAGIPAAPAQAQQSQAIPSDLLSVVPDLPAPPAAPMAKPQPVELDQWGAIPEPPKRAVKPAPVESLYEIPAPPPLPAELAPDFSRVDYERSFDQPFSVDVAATTRKAQAAERNLQTFTQALGDAQREAVTAAQREQSLTQQAAQLDQQISALKGAKKPTAEQKTELGKLTEQRKALDPEIKAAGTAVQDALGRFTSAREQQTIARQDAEQSRQQASTDLATVELEAERRGAAAQQAGAVLFAKESQRIEQDARQQVAKIETEETAARARMDEDRKAYREALKAGPAKQSMVLTVASVIAEALAARQSKRPPDFGRVLGQLEQATKAQFDERVQRQLSLIAEGEDSLSKAAQQKRAIDAQRAAQRAEVLQSIEIDIQAKMAGARGTVAEAQLATVAGDVRAAREAAEMQAIAEQQKAQQAIDKAALDRQLQEAQIRKANAEAAEKEGEVASKAGAGTGSAKEAAWSSRDPNKVYVPFTDTVLATFEGANADKRAEKAGALVTDGFKYMKTLYEYEAMVEDYGNRKLLDRSGWTESDEYRKLATKHARLRTALAKVIAGQGFSTTESDMRAAEKMAPLPTTWNDTTRAALEQMRKDGDDDFRLTLNQAIDTKAQEALIREARRFGTSETELQRALVSRSPALITDTSKPVETRLKAISALSANVRSGNGSDEQSERDAILAELQEIKNATTFILQNEYDPDDPVGGVTDDAHEVVKALRAREAELRSLYREVGADNATKREKERLADPKTPLGLDEKYGGIPSIR